MCLFVGMECGTTQFNLRKTKLIIYNLTMHHILYVDLLIFMVNFSFKSDSYSRTNFWKTT
jgi:hypothetical protein